MGEGVIAGVTEAMINQFAENLGQALIPTARSRV